jgi:hypothetical protein
MSIKAPKKAAPKQRKSQSVYGDVFGFKPKGKKRPPSMISVKEFSRYEVGAVGCITIMWAYLEHMLLIATADLVEGGEGWCTDAWRRYQRQL